MKGNITLAALVFGLCLVASSLITVFGLRWALVSGADRLNVGIREHAHAMASAGQDIGRPISTSLEDLSAQFRHPVLRLDGPIAISQPVVITGPDRGGALPVHALIGK